MFLGLNTDNKAVNTEYMVDVELNDSDINNIYPFGKGKNKLVKVELVLIIVMFRKIVPN